MVAEAFLCARPKVDNEIIDIDHIDRIKLNNKLLNLRYVTHKGNLKNTKRYRTDIQEDDIEKGKTL